MKMRKTVYPIAIIIALPLVLMVFVVLNQGHFIQLEKEQFIQNIQNSTDQSTDVHFRWKGFGNPKITSIHFAEENSTYQIVNRKTSRKTSEAESDLSLQLSADQSDIDEEKPPVLILRYKTFGITKEQVIDLVK